jgi:phosphocarrier protein HPr
LKAALMWGGFFLEIHPLIPSEELPAMLQHQYEIVNNLGLHARASALFVKAATPFSSDVRLGLDGNEVNGKSIMGVMALAAAKGSTIRLIVDGPDEEIAMQAIGTLIQDGFGEI